ncbi:MAG: type domain protein [Herbinix sp.]|jgi:hypothetical protein|nr:type domain protein [Herbinix sp.]
MLFKLLKKFIPIGVIFMVTVMSVTLGNQLLGVADGSVRNLALRRAAYQSSAFGFNETAHLVTDGIIHDIENESKMAIHYSHEHGNDARYGNVKYLFDNDINTRFESFNRNTWVQVQVPRKAVVASYQIASSIYSDWYSASGADPLSWTLQGSNDGTNFTTIDSQEAQSFSGRGVTNTYTVSNIEKAYHYFRLNITGVNGSDRVQFSEWNLLDASGNRIFQPYGEDDFVSCWMSGGNNEEWIYVDLGQESALSSVKIYWGSMYAKTYEIQVSDDTKTWTKVAQDESGTGGVKVLNFDEHKARYVKLLCKSKPTEANLAYIVREFEVYGTNELYYQGDQENKPRTRDDGAFVLTGGNWQVERASEVDSSADAYANPESSNDTADTIGCRIASKEYNSDTWLPAIVPGTVLTSFLKAGAVADPNYGDQQFLVSDSYFKSNFWYRNSFEIPKSSQGQKVWLNFEAINYKAEVYFNGKRLGNINGAFTRAKFDVTEFVNFGKENYLAVLIYNNTDPGTPFVSGEYGPGTMGGVFGNDGSIGADGPTHSASAGWDWVPTVRGRNIGIYNDVFLTYTKELQVIDPWMITTFDPNKDGSFNLSKANLILKTEVHNSNNQSITAIVKGTVKECPELIFEKEIVLEAGQTKEVIFDTQVLEEPKVWWPNTYGDQPLYRVSVSAYIDGVESDQDSFQFGVREFSYKQEPGDEVDPNGYINGKNLALYCNGTRIICRGGNWGMEEINLDVDDETFDDKIRLHHDANLNMIRNWGGQTNDPAFYEACDKYGVLIWDDFFLPGGWLHVPKDVPMFLANAEDKIKDYRSHASLAFYCGINEAWPEKKELEDGFRSLITELDGTRLYFPNSRWDPVGPGGPYAAKGPKFYFKSTTPNLITSERGLPNIPVIESMKAMLPEENLWPKNSMWSLHDLADYWNCSGKQYMLDCTSYGNYTNVEEFVRNAQMVGYENYKAIFEATFDTKSNGMLLWMSQSVWPSLIWQTYDYYHDVNGAYYGVKTGNQPINFIFNIANNDMVLINATPKDQNGLKAIVELYDINGELLYAKSVTKDMKSDTKETLFQLAFDRNASPVQFVKTRVENAAGEILTTDFYWNNFNTYQDYTTMDQIPQLDVKAQYSYIETKDSSRYYHIRVENNSDKPALMIRLKVMNEQSGERVLPVFYEDNYFSLMPGEVKEITLDFKEKNLYGAEPRFELEGFNVNHSVINQGTTSFTIGSMYMEHNGELTGLVSAGTVTISVDIDVSEESNVAGELIAEVYQGNELVDTRRSAFDSKLISGDHFTITTDPIVIPEGEESKEYTIKCYIKEGATLLTPVRKYRNAVNYEPAEINSLKRNLSIGSIVTASTTEEGDNVAKNAIDGNIGSRWASGQGSDDEWLFVDLGKVSEFHSITINWEAAYGKEYYIEVSDDGENFSQIAHKVDGTGGTGAEREDNFDFGSAISARYVRWVGVKRGTNWGYSMYEFAILVNQRPSLTLNAEVTASDYESNDFGPGKIVDGEMSTRWAAKAAVDDHWVLVDLKEPKTFSTIELTWENAYGKEYKLQYSNDGTNFTDIFTETNGSTGTKIYEFNPVTARYIKILMLKRGTGWTYSIYEMNVM